MQPGRFRDQRCGNVTDSFDLGWVEIVLQQKDKIYFRIHMYIFFVCLQQMA